VKIRFAYCHWFPVILAVTVCGGCIEAAETATTLKTGADQHVWELFQATRGSSIDRFNKALDLLNDTDRQSVQFHFDKLNPSDSQLAVFDSYWSDQIAAAAVLVVSSRLEGGTVHLPEGPLAVHYGDFGRQPTLNDAGDAYARTSPNGNWPAIHDPSPALFENGYYYLCATAEGIPTFRSKDRIHWRMIGRAFPKGEQPAWWNRYQPANVVKDPQTGKLVSCTYNPNVFVWAPHLFRYRGNYHLFYAIPSPLGRWRNAAIGHAMKATLDPAVPWLDMGQIISCDDRDPFNAIDPSFVIDRDGNPWMPFGSFSSGGTELVPLDPDTLTVTPGAHKPWAQMTGDGMESPSVIYDRASDRYYLFTSEGFGIGPPWDYKVRCYRTEAGAPIAGPYFDHNGRTALDSTNQIGSGAKNNNPGYLVIDAKGNRVAPGGEAIYTDDVDGKRYMIFHERDNSRWVNPPSAGPLPAFNLQIRELTFDAAGWPVLGPATLKSPDESTASRPAVPPPGMVDRSKPREIR